jgi:hypothetical protein
MGCMGHGTQTISLTSLLHILVDLSPRVDWVILWATNIHHLLIGIMCKDCKHLVADLDLEYYFDEQSGYQTEVMRGYVVDHVYV